MARRLVYDIPRGAIICQGQSERLKPDRRGPPPPSQVAADQSAGKCVVSGLVEAWGQPWHIAGAVRPMPPAQDAENKERYTDVTKNEMESAMDANK